MPPQEADYYALLRVDARADADAIRNAWAREQRLWGVRQNAPDLATRHDAERHVQLLGDVKGVLLDPIRRARYDRERLRPLPLGEAARSAGEGSARARPAREQPSPPPSPRRRGSIFVPLGIGLVGALITGGQVFHWDFAVMLAIVCLVGVPVLAFDVRGLRSVAWVFRTRTRAIVSWILLIAALSYCTVSVLSRM